MKVFKICLMFFLMGLFSQNCYASSFTGVDEGYITNTSLFINEDWYLRPDARTDDDPTTGYFTDFLVRTELDPASTYDTLTLYWNSNQQTNMTYENGFYYGTISGLPYIPNSDTMVHFFIGGYYESGNLGEWDEIPTPVTGGGDPFTFIVSTQQQLPTPEPTTMVLFGIGLLGLTGISRRKK